MTNNVGNNSQFVQSGGGQRHKNYTLTSDPGFIRENKLQELKIILIT
jgi:hypothetical protein